MTGTTAAQPFPDQYAVIDVGDLGEDSSRAFGISNTGVVVGRAYPTWSNRHAFASRRGTIIDLGTLSGIGDSQAMDVSDTGLICGYSHYEGGSGLVA